MIEGEWWGRPELNRRPLPGTVHPRPYGFLLAPESLHPRVVSKPMLISGALNGCPPDPIPNSEVKPRSVSGVSVVFGHVKPGKLAIYLNIKEPPSRQTTLAPYSSCLQR